jgi:prepilin-type processing-associated H-X9-DG protein
MVDGGPPDGLTYAWGWWDWNITISPNWEGAMWWNGTSYATRTLSSLAHPAELATYAVIRAPGYNNDSIGAPQWDGVDAICSQVADDNMGSDTYGNYWNGMLALGASRHNKQIIAAFADGHAGHKPVNSIVLQNCTQYSTAYWNWYAQPRVAQFAGEYWDPTD